MREVPTLTGMDVAFGNISHMPTEKEIPKEYMKYPGPKSCRVAAELFYKGGKLSDHGYKPREGVQAGKATAAIGAILSSFDPSHEMKMAAAGFLIDEWFVCQEEK